MMQARWIQRGSRRCRRARRWPCWSSAAPAARAQDDADDDEIDLDLEQQDLRGIVRGLGLRDATTPASNIASARRWWCRRAATCRRRRPSAPPKDPAWPNDPDVKRAQGSAEAERKNAGSDVEPDVDDRAAAAPERAEPCRRGAAPPAADQRAERRQRCRRRAGCTPSELGYFGGLFTASLGLRRLRNEEPATFTSEPPRTSLTEPPPGYQTPSPAQPYGVGQAKSSARAPTAVRSGHAPVR